MQTMTKRGSGTEEIFFHASSAAALNSYRKTGKIPVAISALVKNGESLDLIPIGSGLPSMDARTIHSALGFALRPLVKYVKENPGSYPLVFFLSVTAEGGLKDLDTGDAEEVKVIINAARTQENEGKTDVYKIVGQEFVKLKISGGDSWSRSSDEKDLPGSVAQTLLDMVWREFIIERNMSLIPNTEA